MRRNKYGAVPTVVDGIRFHSKGEANRWQELKLLERAGEIEHLARQERYPLHVNGEHICDYVCDFWYIDRRTSTLVVEDFKGVRTTDYRIKAKLVKALYGIEIRETSKTSKRKSTKG